MPTDLRTFLQDVQPETTILFFGAGSSIPSHAPSVPRIIDHLSTVFRQSSEGFTLAELTDLIEQKTKDRKRLISEIRTLFKNLKPTGGILNVPLYDWKALYTTNYDELHEASYRLRGRSLLVYSSNFDFGVRGREQATRLYKVHGTISKDISDGHAERMILTGSDFRNLSEYRQHLYRTLQADMAESNLVIIGHSLEDPDIKALADHAAVLNAEIFAGGRITLLMYTPNDDRAMLFENRGMRVVFGGIDEFFAELARKSAAHVLVGSVSDDPFDQHPGLRPVTVDVAYEAEGKADVSRMFNGWPATYGDIREGLTFDRGVASEVTGHIRGAGLCAVITGASGVGKTTAARQATLDLHRNYNFLSWEHKPDHTLEVDDWRDIARALGTAHKQGVLFVDDAHLHIYEINNLIDALVSDKLTSLKLVMATSRNNWQPRLKTPHLFRVGKELYISRLSNTEIESLIYLVDNNTSVRRLVEHTFAGFSLYEKKRRLLERCHADMFVCMRNIFASESYDDIILREFAELSDEYQEIYRHVAALEDSGIRVHRQLIIRLLGIPMVSIASTLGMLTDIVTEYTIDEKAHIYGWMGRHPVISNIITRYKFTDIGAIVALYEKFIENIMPTYDIEVRSIRELCSINAGISRISDKAKQNVLLRKMISAAPGERVPRHRLIRNLIDLVQFDQAQTEIRIFDSDFGTDGPVARYKIILMVERATRTPGIMHKDRLAILEQAREAAVAAVHKYNFVPRVFGAYCEVGVAIYRLSGKRYVFDDAIAEMREAETRIGDPEVTRLIRRFERLMEGQVSEESDADDAL